MTSIQNQQSNKFHLVRLAEHLGLSPLALSLAVFAIVGVVGWLPIAWESYANNVAWRDLISPTITMLINVMAISYIIGMTLFSIRRLGQHLASLRPHYAKGKSEFQALQLIPESSRNPRSHFWITIGGLLFGIALVVGSRLYEGQLGDSNLPGYGSWTTFIIPVLWATIAHATWIFANNAREIGGAARKLPAVDLLDTTTIISFTRIGTAQILFVLGALTLLPLQAIVLGNLDAEDLVPPGIVAILLIGYSVLHPIADARARIREVKFQELEKIAARLREIPSDARMTNDQVPKLLAYRSAIEQVDEWPISGSTLLRLGFYVFIPPVTWALAAVISFYVETFFETL